jgi:hypothetical protein
MAMLANASAALAVHRDVSFINAFLVSSRAKRTQFLNELRATSSTILDKSLENTFVKYNDCNCARKCARTLK